MSEKAEALTRPCPNTPAGRQLGWWLGRLIDEGEGAAPADWDRYEPELRPEHGGEITELAVAPTTELDVTATIRTAKDRKWSIRLVVSPQWPHRMARFDIERKHDFELGFREATPDDAELLSDLESRCPIVMGDTSVHFERGTHYWDGLRLMDDVSVGLASVDGVPAAVSCGAYREVRIGGAMKKMVVVSHLRVLPEHQRKGLWGAANRVLNKYWDRVDGSQAYIAVDNLAMQHGFTGTPNKWGQVVERLLLDTAALAGPPAGRPATPADAAEIAARLNAIHDAEEMFVPYTAETLTARLTRAPQLFSWDRVWLTDKAVVGVWPAGDAQKVVTATAGVRTVSVSAVVLDYAFAPGGEAELEALLRAWCGWLAPKGMDTLVIYTSPASPGTALLNRLARSNDRFFTWTPGIEVPPGSEGRGLYTDAIYF